MKQLISIMLVIWIPSIATPDPDIIGQWEHKSVRGDLFGINIRKDGTFSSYVNKKAFTSGQYTYREGLFSFVEDNGCTDSAGAKYRSVSKLVFFAADSFRIDVVSDGCTGRRDAVNGSKYGRVQKP